MAAIPLLAVAGATETDLPPCALVNVDGKIIIGTYKLNEETKLRTGSLDVYSEDLKLLTSTPTKSAILDVRFHDGSIYTAHSTGEVCIWTLESVTPKLVKELVVDQSALVLQIALQNTEMVATLSSGEVVYFDLNTVKEVWRSQTHSLEAWTCAFDLADNGIYTGGDDMLFAYHDKRMGMPIWKLRHHDAGVTSILLRSEHPSGLWTGGYDDQLRVVDLRTRRAVDNINLGGGVWRLIPNGPDGKIIACCMYGGLRILKSATENDLALPVVEGTLENHQSMVYGADWSGSYGYSCSFYDRLVQKWSI